MWVILSMFKSPCLDICQWLPFLKIGKIRDIFVVLWLDIFRNFLLKKYFDFVKVENRSELVSLWLLKFVDNLIKYREFFIDIFYIDSFDVIRAHVQCWLFSEIINKKWCELSRKNLLPYNRVLIILHWFIHLFIVIIYILLLLPNFDLFSLFFLFFSLFSMNTFYLFQIYLDQPLSYHFLLFF